MPPYSAPLPAACPSPARPRIADKNKSGSPRTFAAASLPPSARTCKPQQIYRLTESRACSASSKVVARSSPVWIFDDAPLSPSLFKSCKYLQRFRDSPDAPRKSKNRIVRTVHRNIRKNRPDEDGKRG